MTNPTPHDEDAMLHRNLDALGRCLELPQEPTDFQLARWRDAPRVTDGDAEDVESVQQTPPPRPAVVAGQRSKPDEKTPRMDLAGAGSAVAASVIW